MIAIEDIVDKDSFRAWLDDLAQDRDETSYRALVTGLAMRSAARLLPIYWDWTLTNEGARKSGLTALSLLRSLIISSVTALAPSRDIVVADTAAIDAVAFPAVVKAVAASASVTDAAINAVDPHVVARRAVVAVAEAAAAARAFARNIGLSAGAVFSTQVNTAFIADTAIWGEIRGDCRAILAGNDIAKRGLWQEGGFPTDDPWPGLEGRIRGQSGDWDFWVAWYNKLRAGETMPIELLTKIALIEPDTWDEGAEAVNPIIAQMCRDFGYSFDAAKASGAPGMLIETQHQILARNARVVTMQLATLIEFINQQINLLKGSNRITDTEARDKRILKLSAILEMVQEIADAFPEGEMPASNAMEVIEENLPAVVEQADNLPAVVGEPEVSESIIVLAANVKVLTDAGVSGDLAAKIAGADLGRKSLGKVIVNWWQRRKSN